jgi:cobalt/nickel transport system permease protein
LRDRPGRGAARGPAGERVDPGLKLASTFLLVLLTSLSRGALFVELASAIELGLLCFLPGRAIAGILRKAGAAGLFAAAIMLPAMLSGGPGHAPILVAKILLAVLAVSSFSATTGWPSVSRALASLRCPELFILTLDLAIKYIVLLGGLVLDMLRALELRSVGRNDRKGDSLAAIAGTTYLKSREAARAQYEAMECRCFSGAYRVTRPSLAERRSGRCLAPNAALAAADLAFALAFFAFGRTT